MMKIPLIKSSFFEEKEMKDELSLFIQSCEKLSMGDQCEAFERAYAKYQGVAYAVLYNSGSSANLALIQALLNTGRLVRGDKVGFSAITWATSVMPLLQFGLVPVPIEVNIGTLNVDSPTVSKFLDENDDIKCLFITHVLGFCGDMINILEVCKSREVLLLEDTCESLGSEIGGKKLGSFGLASTFSTFVGHHLSTIEGGLVCTDDKALSDSLKMVRAHGWDRNLDVSEQSRLRKKYDVDSFYSLYSFYDLGFNLRPTELTGFLGQKQLRYALTIVKSRENNFRAFKAAADQNPDFIPLQLGHMDVVSNFAFPLVCYNAAKIGEYKHRFLSAGVEVRPVVGGNITRQPFFRKYMKGNWVLPNADQIHDCGIYLPNNPELTNEEITYMVNQFKK